MSSVVNQVFVLDKANITEFIININEAQAWQYVFLGIFLTFTFINGIIKIMILGHYANTYVVQNLAKRYNIEFSLYFLLFGAYLPDLIDKPLNMLFQLPGRGIAHSVIIQALLFSPLIYSLPKYRKAFLSIWFGCILHLIQDTIALSIAFWPIVGSLSDYRRFSFSESFYTYYILVKYPYTLFAEVLSFVISGGILLSKWMPEGREMAEEKVHIDKEDYKY